MAIALVTSATVVERYFSFPIVQIDKNAQLSFFSTLAQVSAAFLTLYFTALSIVAGTYARVPGDLRSRLVQEEVGSFYFGALAQFAAVTVVLLAALAFGLSIGPLNTLIASAFGLFAVFSFVVLGIRAFHFFDPAALVEHLNAHIFRSVQSVTPSGQKWLDQSFQAHHQKRVDDLLGSYSNLIAVASQKENLHSKALVKIAEGLFSVIRIYTAVKTTIPTESFWFKRRNSHKDWLLASFHEVEIALATGTVIQPKSVPDLNWLESKVYPLIGEILFQLRERKELSGAIAVAGMFQDTMNLMGSLGAIEEGVDAIQALSNQFHALAGIEKQFSADEKFAIERLGILELNNCAFINLVLGYSSCAKSLSPSNLDRLLSQIDWSKGKTIYASRQVPRRLRAELEFLQTSLDFEQRLEHRLVSPSWLILEMTGRGATCFLHETTEKVLSEFERCFPAEIENQLKLKNFAVVAQFMQRGLEAGEKLRSCFSELRLLHDEYIALNRSKEYAWPTIEWETFDTRLLAARRRIILGVAASVHHLTSLPEDQWPDFFGHGYVLLGEECMRAMIAGDDDLFKRIFPALFFSALQATDRLRKKFEAPNLQQMGVINTPLLDVMEISGYAAVFGELESKDYFQTMQRCWDAYFAQMTDKERIPKFINLLVALTGPDLYFTGRSVQRTQWQQRIEHCLRKRGLMPDPYGSFGREFVVPHDSPVVRAFARGRGHTNACDVFLSLYLLNRPEASSTESPYSTEAFNRALDAERQRGNESEAGDEEES